MIQIKAPCMMTINAVFTNKVIRNANNVFISSQICSYGRCTLDTKGTSRASRNIFKD